MSHPPFPPTTTFPSLPMTSSDIPSSPPMTDAQVHDLAHTRWRRSRLWWEAEAFRAIAGRRFQIIHGRNDQNVYLVRMWLRQPQISGVRGDGFESGNEVLLHYFARGDDDAALHDHPWDFTTTILTGSYLEHLPPRDWEPGSELGPAWDTNVVIRSNGETLVHQADDLHCVGAVCPGTWSLVRTGLRRREWGFHPPGQPWLSQDAYLSARRSGLAVNGATGQEVA